MTRPAVTRMPPCLGPGLLRNNAPWAIHLQADALTEDAQTAMRRTMEEHTSVTRFCFICNYVSRIIDPIASRCAKFRFKPVIDDLARSRLEHICEEEKLDFSEVRCDKQPGGR